MITQGSTLRTEIVNPINEYAANEPLKWLPLGPEYRSLLDCNDECKMLRREALDKLRGSVIVVVCTGKDPVKAGVYLDWLRFGFKLVVLDDFDNQIAVKLAESHPDSVLHVAFDLETPNVALAEECHFALKKALTEAGLGRPRAVVTIWDDAIALQSRLAAAFEVPSNTIQSVDICHDKFATREKLRAAGFPSPRTVVVKSERDLKFAKDLCFPLILKPVYGAASIGVRKVIDVDSLGQVYDDVVETLNSCYKENELMGLVFADSTDTCEGSRDALGWIVAEEFLNGPEFDCDVVLDGGRAVVAKLSDDWPYRYPHFVELGTNTPSMASQEDKEKVVTAAVNACRVLGLSLGPCHVEVILDKRLGPVIIEVNARMGGGPIRDNVLLVWELDLACAVILCGCGISLLEGAQDLAPMEGIRTAVSVSVRPGREKPHGAVATAVVFAERSGSVHNANKVFSRLLLERREAYEKMLSEFGSDVNLIVRHKMIGAEKANVTGWYDGYPSFLGYMTVQVNVDVRGARKLVDVLRAEYLEALHVKCSST